MGLLSGRSMACSSRRLVGMSVVVILIFQFSATLGQGPVIFQYGSFWGPDGPFQVPNAPDAQIAQINDENITSLGDFQFAPNGGANLSWTPGPGSRDMIGRLLYKNPVQLIQTCSSPPTVASFSTMFQLVFHVEKGYVPSIGTMQGLAFIITGGDSTQAGEAGGYLGWLNSTTDGQASTPHNFAVEIDFFQDVKFNDPSHVHVGLDQNSLTSLNTSILSWLEQSLADYGEGGVGLNLWIEYDSSTQLLEVFGTGTGGPTCSNGGYLWPGLFCKPPTPIISTNVDLTDSLTSPHGMFVGFSGSISNQTDNNPNAGVTYSISGWTFNSNGFAPDHQRDTDGFVVEMARSPRGATERTIILAVTVPSVLVFLSLVFVISILYRRNTRLTSMAKKYEIEKGLLNRGPQNFQYRVLSRATNGFSSLLGSGGFGSVYRGKIVLKGEEYPSHVAVKRISRTSRQGAEEFVAEVKVIGQAQHRNLVRLLGWCHEKGELLLVYDYMPNGSVDQHLYKSTSRELVLTWSRRLRILSGVATALAYLHEEWDQRVIHRDVKPSNVMLDRDFNARLGDFGLARLSEHDQAPASTVALAGTFGYMAPELARTLTPTEKTDVYSFGATVLEVATGKKPLLSQVDRESLLQVLLVDWVWELYGDDALLDAADSNLHNTYDPGEMIVLLKIGLLCCHPDPDERPTMREVINIWKGSSPFPPLPRSKPVPVFSTTTSELSDDSSDVELAPSTSGSQHGDISEAQNYHVFHSKTHSSSTHSIIDVGNVRSDSLPSPEQYKAPKRSAEPTVRHRGTITSLPF